MTKLVSTVAIVLAATSQLGSTDCGNALRDPGFDLWCGDALCAWKVERGDIKRVPTWNEGDPGVELVGNDVAIEQLSPIDSGDGSCIEFDLIANIDLDASVYLRVDVFGDGSVEHQDQLPTAQWAPLSFKLPIQGVFKGVRFELAKTGPGHAVLAQISAKFVDSATPGCDNGALPIVPAPAPLGAPCSDGTGCTSNLCGHGPGGGMECIACDDTSAMCASGSVCGLGDPTSPVREPPIECVATAARALGERCLADAECATGVCAFAIGAVTMPFPGTAYGSCSTCRPSATQPTGCATSEACGPAWPVADVNPNGDGPFVCSPNAHVRAHGEPCASDDDCASSACSGTPRQQCDDGRACATAADCPFGGADTVNGLQNGPCNVVGVQGGSCQ